MNDNEYAACETVAEVIVAVYRLHGLDAVDKLLRQTECTREALRRDADNFEAIGMKQLASVLRQHARKARKAKPIFRPGYQTESARIIIARRRS